MYFLIKSNNSLHFKLFKCLHFLHELLTRRKKSNLHEKNGLCKLIFVRETKIFWGLQKVNFFLSLSLCINQMKVQKLLVVDQCVKLFRKNEKFVDCLPKWAKWGEIFVYRRIFFWGSLSGCQGKETSNFDEFLPSSEDFCEFFEIFKNFQRLSAHFCLLSVQFCRFF